jgi:hypothetical protein
LKSIKPEGNSLQLRILDFGLRIKNMKAGHARIED